MVRIVLIIAFGFGFCLDSLTAYGNPLDDIHLFQAFYRDVVTEQTPYGEGFIQFADHDAGKGFRMGAQGGFPVIPDLEINSEMSFINLDPDKGDSEKAEDGGVSMAVPSANSHEIFPESA